MTGYIKVTAEAEGNLQRVFEECELNHVREEDTAMILAAVFGGLELDIKNRRAVRKILRLARKFKPVNTAEC